MAFRGFVEGAITGRRGWALRVLLREGLPTVGDQVACEGRTGEVVMMDDRGVRTQACLPGEPTTSHIWVAVEWEGAGQAPRRGEIASLPEEPACSTAS